MDITLSATYKDIESLEFVVTQQPKYGVLSGSGRNLKYTPFRNFYGEDFFMFKAVDGDAQSDESIVKLNVKEIYIPKRPLSPVVIEAYPESATQLHIRWSPSMDVATSFDLIKYNIHVSSDPDFVPREQNRIKSVQGVTDVIIDGLESGVVYFFAVLAENSAGYLSRSGGVWKIRMAENKLVFKQGLSVFYGEDLGMEDFVFHSDRVTAFASKAVSVDSGTYVVFGMRKEGIPIHVLKVSSAFYSSGGAVTISGSYVSFEDIISEIDLSHIFGTVDIGARYYDYLAHSFGYDSETGVFAKSSPFNKTVSFRQACLTSP